jgi:hypothetical protein
LKWFFNYTSRNYVSILGVVFQPEEGVAIFDRLGTPINHSEMAQKIGSKRKAKLRPKKTIFTKGECGERLLV